MKSVLEEWGIPVAAVAGIILLIVVIAWVWDVVGAWIVSSPLLALPIIALHVAWLLYGAYAVFAHNELPPERR